jgi:hypothetical protein
MMQNDYGIDQPTELSFERRHEGALRAVHDDLFLKGFSAACIAKLLRNEDPQPEHVRNNGNQFAAGWRKALEILQEESSKLPT